MSIQTVNSMNNLLKSYNADQWIKSADPDKGFDYDKGLSLSDSPANKVNDLGNKISFSDMLTSQIAEVNNLQAEANKAIENLVTGKSKNIHETMIAVEQADIAFKTMNQIRLKVIDAYREIMRMQM